MSWDIYDGMKKSNYLFGDDILRNSWGVIFKGFGCLSEALLAKTVIMYQK